MNYLKHPATQSSKYDEAKDKARPLTPKSERPRHTYGSLLTSVQTVPGLCQEDRKCFRKAGHLGLHYPTDQS